MSIDNLKAGVESLKNALRRTNTKRQHWNDVAMPLVKNVFQKVIDEFDLNWNIESHTKKTNATEIKLSFGKVASGIEEVDEQAAKSFEKFGGALAFVQLYNGDIEVRYLVPYIEQIKEPSHSFNNIEEVLDPSNCYRTLRKVAPENIDDEFVYLQIGKLLTESIAWESGSSEEKMG